MFPGFHLFGQQKGLVGPTFVAAKTKRLRRLRPPVPLPPRPTTSLRRLPSSPAAGKDWVPPVERPGEAPPPPTQPNGPSFRVTKGECSATHRRSGPACRSKDAERRRNTVPKKKRGFLSNEFLFLCVYGKRPGNFPTRFDPVLLYRTSQWGLLFYEGAQNHSVNTEESSLEMVGCLFRQV